MIGRVGRDDARASVRRSRGHTDPLGARGRAEAVAHPSAAPPRVAVRRRQLHAPHGTLYGSLCGHSMGGLKGRAT